MTLSELHTIVAKGESLYVEFKHKVNFPEKIAREVVAFANTVGGKLFVGVDDNKTIYGLKDADEEIFALKSLLDTYIKLPINYNIERLRINVKKEIVVLTVDESKKKPNYAFEGLKDRFGSAYVRVADKSIKASPEMIRILKRQSEDSKVFTFGELEKQVISLLDKEESLNITKVQNRLLISKQLASDVLVNLTLSGITLIIPNEKEEDRYVIKV